MIPTKFKRSGCKQFKATIEPSTMRKTLTVLLAIKRHDIKI